MAKPDPLFVASGEVPLAQVAAPLARLLRNVAQADESGRDLSNPLLADCPADAPASERLARMRAWEEWQEWFDRQQALGLLEFKGVDLSGLK